MHSHLLPGIDDGAPTVAESVALIRRMKEMGFSALYTTPHVMADLYPNTPEIINNKLTEVRTALKTEGIAMKIGAAAEYLMDEAFADKIKTGKLLTLPGNRVLVEMSFVSPPPSLHQYIFQLQTKGYRVILAHPERYLFYRDDWKSYESLKDRGVEFQLNWLSLIGYYGKPCKDLAIELLKKGWVNYLGTDLHHQRHADNLTSLLQDRSLAKLLSRYQDTFENHHLQTPTYS